MLTPTSQQVHRTRWYVEPTRKVWSASVSNLLYLQTRLQLQCRRTRPFHYPDTVHVKGHLQGAHSLSSSMKNMYLACTSPFKQSLWAEWKLRGREIQLDEFSDTTKILHRHLLPSMTQQKHPTGIALKTDWKLTRLCVWFACLKTCSSLFSPNKLQQTATILQSKMWHGSWQGFL